MEARQGQHPDEGGQFRHEDPAIGTGDQASRKGPTEQKDAIDDPARHEKRHDRGPDTRKAFERAAGQHCNLVPPTPPRPDHQRQ